MPAKRLKEKPRKTAKAAKTARASSPPKARKGAQPSELSSNGQSEAEPDFSTLQKMFEDAVAVDQARPALEWVEVECPYCGESFEVCVDPGESGQSMTQDCSVCCKSVQLAVEVEEGDVEVSAYRD